MGVLLCEEVSACGARARSAEARAEHRVRRRARGGSGARTAHVRLLHRADRLHAAHGRLVLRVDGELELAAEDVGGATRVDAAQLERAVQCVDLGLHLLHREPHGEGSDLPKAFGLSERWSEGDSDASSAEERKTLRICSKLGILFGSYFWRLCEAQPHLLLKVHDREYASMYNVIIALLFTTLPLHSLPEILRSQNLSLCIPSKWYCRSDTQIVHCNVAPGGAGRVGGRVCALTARLTARASATGRGARGTPGTRGAARCARRTRG